MSSYLDKTGLERVWSKATDKFATIATTDEHAGKILNLETNSATKEELNRSVSAAVSRVIAQAPETLDTLNELAAALGDDPNFATTIATEVGKKVNSSEYNDAIAGINANIASITPEKIGALNKEEYLGPVVLEGNPIVYESGTEGLGIAAVSYLEPKQEGSGDPYPAGGGKNLLPITAKTQTINGVTFTVDNGVITVNGTATANAYLWLCDEFTLQPGTYVMSGIPENFDYDTQGGFTDDNWSINRYGVTTLTEAKKVKPYIVVRNGVTASNVVFKLQLELGSVATDYAPPSNIRPIIGYDAVKLNHAGKNLLNNVRYYDNTHTDIRAQYDNPLLLKAGVTYTLSTNFQADGLFFVDAVGEGSLEAQYLLNYQYQVASLSYTPTADVRCMFVAIFNSGVPNGATIQLEVGSATAYEPYQGNNYTVQIGQTVYGGKMDWLTGKLVAEWAVYTVTGEEQLNVFPDNPGTCNRFGVILPEALTDNTETLCSHFHLDTVRDWAYSASDVDAYYGVYRITSGYVRFILPAKTLSEAQTLLAAQNAVGTPVQIAYKLKTPIEIQLTPTQISELEGINTLYGDGSNIRAIFNTTGSASPILESISGILPVEKGGTGSTSAAGARNNLGITPENIGALPVDGTAKEANALKSQQNFGSGHLDFAVDSLLYRHGIDHTAEGMFPTGNNATGLLTLNTYPFNSNFYFQMGFSVTDGIIYTRAFNDKVIDTTTPWVELLNTSNFKNHVTPTSIGAVQQGTGIGQTGVNSNAIKIGYSPEGKLKCTVDNTDFGEIFTERSACIPLTNGGTGANNAATARSNLGITPANIGAAPTSHASTATTYGVGSTTNYGHLKVGSNISVSSGTISLTKANVTSALGYTPPTTDTNTTYTFATGDSNGQIKVTPSGGSAQNISVKGLGSAAYKNASGSWGISVTGSSASCTGNAATATTLSATLAIGKGGTGITSNPSMLVNLSSTSAASVFAASPRPGITGTLGIGNGGTGATSKSGARTNLGITSGTSLPSSASAGDIFFLYN